MEGAAYRARQLNVHPPSDRRGVEMMAVEYLMYIKPDASLPAEIQKMLWS